MKSLIPARPTKAGVPSISEDGTFITAPLSWLPWLAGVPNTLTEEGSLALPTIYACVRVISEDVASLPWLLYREDGEGKERASEHPLYSVFHDAPNPQMTSFTWRETTLTHLLTWGNAYSEITYDSFGNLQLWPLPPAKVEVKWENNAKAYYWLGSTRKRFRDGTIFHVMGQSLNGLIGMSPIAVHRATLGEHASTRQFGRAFYDNMARPATILKHPKALSTPAAERLKAQVEELKGSRNAGKTVVLEEGLDFAEIGIPPEDAQYLETRKLQREEAAQIYRMQQHKVGILDHATFSNIEHQQQDYVSGTLRPWLVRLEQAVKTQLLADEPELYTELLVDALLRGDSKSRAEALAIRWQHGNLSPNEWRKKENENPIEGGDTYYVPVNYQAATSGEEPAEEQPADDEAFPPLVAVKSAEVRCQACGRKVADLATPPYRFTCRCKAVTEVAA